MDEHQRVIIRTAPWNYVKSSTPDNSKVIL